ncbi:unnamed protein product [Lepeophtheirus salmonis]|uniref:(salmon louse) hypothetical protein n=1 Tax=Lepeophtheirus salmonis TaxID=72036 RepID=A0A7R8GZN4_LEPSM|nr:unnamed protein product [Lepeophtheirus salmonis]CAF2767479.1 unnamed protein product [Lepeophtheirus salmonis]
MTIKLLLLFYILIQCVFTNGLDICAENIEKMCDELVNVCATAKDWEDEGLDFSTCLECPKKGENVTTKEGSQTTPTVSSSPLGKSTQKVTPLAKGTAIVPLIAVCQVFPQKKHLQQLEMRQRMVANKATKLQVKKNTSPSVVSTQSTQSENETITEESGADISSNETSTTPNRGTSESIGGSTGPEGSANVLPSELGSTSLGDSISIDNQTTDGGHASNETSKANKETSLSSNETFTTPMKGSSEPRGGSTGPEGSANVLPSEHTSTSVGGLISMGGNETTDSVYLLNQEKETSTEESGTAHTSNETSTTSSGGSSGSEGYGNSTIPIETTSTSVAENETMDVGPESNKTLHDEETTTPLGTSAKSGNETNTEGSKTTTSLNNMFTTSIGGSSESSIEGSNSSTPPSELTSTSVGGSTENETTEGIPEKNKTSSEETTPLSGESTKSGNETYTEGSGTSLSSNETPTTPIRSTSGSSGSNTSPEGSANVIPSELKSTSVGDSISIAGNETTNGVQEKSANETKESGTGLPSNQTSTTPISGTFESTGASTGPEGSANVVPSEFTRTSIGGSFELGNETTNGGQESNQTSREDTTVSSSESGNETTESNKTSSEETFTPSNGSTESGNETNTEESRTTSSVNTISTTLIAGSSESNGSSTSPEGSANVFPSDLTSTSIRGSIELGNETTNGVPEINKTSDGETTIASSGFTQSIKEQSTDEVGIDSSLNETSTTQIRGSSESSIASTGLEESANNTLTSEMMDTSFGGSFELGENDTMDLGLETTLGIKRIHYSISDGQDIFNTTLSNIGRPEFMSTSFNHLNRSKKGVTTLSPGTAGLNESTTQIDGYQKFKIEKISKLSEEFNDQGEHIIQIKCIGQCGVQNLTEGRLLYGIPPSHFRRQYYAGFLF